MTRTLMATCPVVLVLLGAWIGSAGAASRSAGSLATGAPQPIVTVVRRGGLPLLAGRGRIDTSELATRRSAVTGIGLVPSRQASCWPCVAPYSEADQELHQRGCCVRHCRPFGRSLSDCNPRHKRNQRRGVPGFNPLLQPFGTAPRGGARHQWLSARQTASVAASSGSGGRLKHSRALRAHARSCAREGACGAFS